MRRAARRRRTVTAVVVSLVAAGAIGALARCAASQRAPSRDARSASSASLASSASMGSTLGVSTRALVAPIDSTAPGEQTHRPPPGPGRGFPVAGPWVSCYGDLAHLGDLDRIASTFRIINIDADPSGALRPEHVRRLQRGGGNRVISYLNVGACERFRTYWGAADDGFVSCGANTRAHLGGYDGYPDETWMNPADPEYQRLLVEWVAPRLAAQGVDGFYLDNLEILSHGTATANGPCDANCVRGGLALVKKLRDAFPEHLIVLQNGTGPVTRLGLVGGVSFPSLLDGISHEEVFAPKPDDDALDELRAWRQLGLRPGGRPFWIATEDYVGSCNERAAAKGAITRSRAEGFSPYVADASSKQRHVCYWGM